MDDTRQRLLDAAGQTFADKGFEGATVRDICRIAEANIAAVNYHFGDKERLYIEAVRQAACRPQGIPEFGWTAETPPEQKLEDFLRDMITMMIDDQGPPWHIELMMREMARPTSACGEVVRSFIGPMFGMLLGIVGELRPDASPIDRRLIAFSIVGQCLLYRYQRAVGRMLLTDDEHRAIWDVDRLTRHITDFSLAGLRGSARPPVAESVP